MKRVRIYALPASDFEAALASGLDHLPPDAVVVEAWSRDGMVGMKVESTFFDAVPECAVIPAFGWPPDWPACPAHEQLRGSLGRALAAGSGRLLAGLVS